MHTHMYTHMHTHTHTHTHMHTHTSSGSVVNVPVFYPARRGFETWLR